MGTQQSPPPLSDGPQLPEDPKSPEDPKRPEDPKDPKEPPEEDDPPEEPPCREVVCRARLLGDTDRSDEPGDDRIDPSKDEPGKRGWTWGPTGRGAIVLHNCDFDDAPPKLDDTDTVVNGAGDVPDLVPVRLFAWPQMPPGWSAVLRATETDAIRVFDARAVGAKAVLGKDVGPEWVIPDLRTKDIIVGVEATGFPGERGPELDLILEVRDPGGRVVCDDCIRLRIAPWMTQWHGRPAVTVHIVKASDNAPIRDVLRGVLGAKLVETDDAEDYDLPPDDDRWVQDWMQFGATHITKHRFPVVLESDRAPIHLIEFDTYPRLRILGKDFGWDHENVQASTLDSFGNLECTPPLKVTACAPLGRLDQEWPFGRIYYGRTPGSAPTVTPFVEAQRVQEPFPIPTGWLNVQHADEVCSFVPASTSLVPGQPERKWRLLMASPRRAIRMLRLLRTLGEGGAMVRGDVLDEYGWPYLDTVDSILNDAALIRYNLRTAQRRIDAARRRMMREADVCPWEIVEVPVLFEGGDALTANSVNLQVAVTDAAHLFVPRPHGPVIRIGGREVDVFALDIALRVGLLLGNRIHWVDTWEAYHLLNGEIHCGTAVHRTQRTDVTWWQMEEP